MRKKIEKTLQMDLLRNKTILITGGAGSIGSHLTKRFLDFPVGSIRILDIDEHALFKLKRSISDSRLRFLLGNILDKERIEMAANNADIIIHTAAIKNIEISEFNPIETIDTNTNGTINLIKIANKNHPKIFINISTDKAANPSTLYGTTKQLSERLTTWAGKTNDETNFASIRFGNVFETRGNVFEVWNNEKKNKKPLSITDIEMERYFFHLDEAVNFIFECLPLANKGEIFVPKMKSYNIRDIALKISENYNVIGARKGEKMKELLITDEEKMIAEERENMWIIK